MDPPPLGPQYRSLGPGGVLFSGPLGRDPWGASSGVGREGGVAPAGPAPAEVTPGDQEREGWPSRVDTRRWPEVHSGQWRGGRGAAFAQKVPPNGVFG